MGTIFRCCLILAGVTVWLIFCFAAVEGSLSRNSRNNFQSLTWFLEDGWSETPYSECDELLAGSFGKVTKVEVVGCDADPCELKAGTSATVNIGFISNVNVTSFKPVVHGVIGVVPVPFHVPHPDGCKDSGVTCPLVAGKAYQYTNTISVLKNYPKIAVKVKWELVTNDGKDILCLLIPAKIVA